MSRQDTDGPEARERQAVLTVARAPLLPVAIGLAGGIAIDHSLAPPAWSLVVIAAAALFALVLPRVRSRYAWSVALLAAACGGGLRHDDCFRRVAREHVVHYAAMQPVVVRVEGVVLTEPIRANPRSHFFRRWTYQSRRTGFVLDVASLDTRDGPRRVCGIIQVRVDEEIAHVRAGDRVSAFGTMYRPGGPRNPGQFDYALWLRRQGVLVSMRCRGSDLVTVTAAAVRPWRAWLADIKRTARGMLLADAEAFGDEERSLVETVVLGRRQAIEPQVEERFLRTGTTHFLAVSGVHVGVVAGFVWLMTRWLGAGRRRGAWVTLAGIVLFAVMVDPRPSVFRAAIIGVMYCVGVLLGRTSHGVNSTALAGIVLLWVRPTMLFDPGFQMSFAGVLAILYLHGPLVGIWRRVAGGRRPVVDPVIAEPSELSVSRQAAQKLNSHVVSLAAVGLAAWMATAPIAWFHFGRVAPLGWFNSLIVFPFFTATLVGGVVLTLAGVVFPVTLAVLAPVVNAAAASLLGVVAVLDDVTRSVGSFGAIAVQAAGLASIVVISRWSYVRSGFLWFDFRAVCGRWLRPDDRVTGRWRVAGLALVAGLVVAVVAAVDRPVGSARPLAERGFWFRGRDRALRVTWLAVGAGSATVIEFPDGRTWLYDCGSTVSSDVGRSTIVPFLRHRGIGHIERIIVSHPNIDHFSGLMSILDEMPCESVVVNRHFEGVSPPDGPAAAMLVELARRGQRVDRLDAERLQAQSADVVIEWYWPPDDLPGDVEPNETSTVLRLSYRGRSVLLSGDIETYAIDALLARGDVSADVLVLPHHGGVTGNTAAFVAAVNPRVCIRSSHRRADRTPAELLEAVGDRPHFNTADDGAVTLVVDGGGLSVTGHLRHAGGNYAIRHEAAARPVTINR